MPPSLFPSWLLSRGALNRGKERVLVCIMTLQSVARAVAIVGARPLTSPFLRPYLSYLSWNCTWFRETKWLLKYLWLKAKNRDLHERQRRQRDMRVAVDWHGHYMISHAGTLTITTMSSRCNIWCQHFKLLMCRMDRRCLTFPMIPSSKPFL